MERQVDLEQIQIYIYKKLHDTCLEWIIYLKFGEKNSSFTVQN
jgi:hypothetical protein